MKKLVRLVSLFLVALTVVLMSVPALAIEGEWSEPNPPRNPDGSFPDGRKAKIIPTNPVTIKTDEGIFPPDVHGDPKKGIVVVIVNGNVVNFPDQQPYIANGRTMVPVRFVTEALGAQVDCSKDGIVSIDRGNVRIRMKIGENKATVNGVVKTFDVPSVLTPKYRTMVPLRFISETLGAEVNWNQETYVVRIDLKE